MLDLKNQAVFFLKQYHHSHSNSELLLLYLSALSSLEGIVSILMRLNSPPNKFQNPSNRKKGTNNPRKERHQKSENNKIIRIGIDRYKQTYQSLQYLIVVLNNKYLHEVIRIKILPQEQIHQQDKYLKYILRNKLQLQNTSNMYDSNYPSNKKRTSNFEDTTYLPTAEKSYRDPSGFLEKTPTRLQFQSPSRQSARLSDAKKSINEVIEMVSSKKLINHEAIEEIRNVNHEIASTLSSYNPAKTSHYEHRNRTADHFRGDSSRDLVATSQFDWQVPADNHNPNRSQKQSEFSHENVELRTRLNEEIRKNNELIKYIKSIENQNANLRSSCQTSPISANNLIEQNRYLKSQLTSAHPTSNSSVPLDILEELRKLKEQNQMLRRDTITLLKGKSH